MASTRIYRTAGTPTNDKIWTISGWFKFHSNDGHVIFASDGNNNTSWTQSRWNNGRLELGSYSTLWLRTNRVFRDYNAWYHIMYVADSTQATASNRLKIYVNGVEETSFETDNRSSTTQNQSWGWNKNGAVNNIGGENASGYGNFTCSHFHNIDGTALTPSTFGETDSTTGEWKINTSPTISSYGNNGFFWLKDSVATTDHSPNSNTFTVGGTLTKTEDCPSNVFATWNGVFNLSGTLSNGNNTYATSTSYGSQANTATSTLGVSTGKYYAEFKHSGTSGSYPNGMVGVYYNPEKFQNGTTNPAQSNDEGFGYAENGTIYNNGTTATGTTYTTGDIIGVALDLDGSKVYWYKNGTLVNSGGTTIDTGETYFFFVADTSSGGSTTYQANFGNGYFGTTAVSSAGTNASGIGIFEYDVPTGYTALSTKGLNE